MNIVIIIGNGFDLNLGLETRYSDFIESDEFKSLIKNNSTLAIYLKEKHFLQNWIDIENELKIYSREIYKDENRGIFKNEYKSLCTALCDYINNLDYNIINQNSFAYDYIERMLALTDNNISILNFNYSNSVYEIIKNKNSDHIKILEVHGKASKNNIVFGVEDGASINPNDIFLLKSASKYFNCDVNVENKLKEAELIITIGHSLGETDHFYFNNFFHTQSFGHCKSKTIVITHHTDDDWDKIMKQLDTLTINNIASFRQNNNLNFEDI